MNILVTGANGFVGSHLIEQLSNSGHHIIALVRDKKKIKNKDGIKWIEGDLLNPEKLPDIGQIDRAYYLVHGLKSDASEFEYYESLAAVHFVNWIKPTGASIIYLGGLGPKDAELSPHLRSRHLTGAILGISGLPVIEFRASIILGAGSLSFEMIKAISERFPIRPDLSILRQSAQPLSLKDLMQYLISASELNVEGHHIFEIGTDQALSYGELLDLYAKIAGKHRLKIKVPHLDVRILVKILDYAIPEYADVGAKLSESLVHPTVVTNSLAQEYFPEIKPMSLQESMEAAIKSSKTHYASIWEKEFLKDLLSDKVLIESGLFSNEVISKIKKFEQLIKLTTKKN